MNTYQQKYGKMLDILQEEYKTNKAVYAIIPAMNTAFDNVFDTYTEINKLSQSQEKNNTGVTKTKAERKDELAAAAYLHASGMAAWAIETKDATVLQEVECTEKSLQKLNDKLIVPRCKNIYDLAKTNLALLGNYGISEDSLVQLAVAIQAFEDALPSSKKNVQDRSGDTKKMVALFANIKTIIDKVLKKLAVQLKKDHMDVYNSFMASIALPKNTQQAKKDAKRKTDTPKALPTPTE